MSKVDRIKEEIGWLKIVFAVLIAVDISLVAWLAQNYQLATRLLVGCAVVAVIFVSAGVVWVNRAAMRRFEALGVE